MKLLLGQPYLNGGGEDGKKWYTLSLPFWNEECRGESYRYARLCLHVNDSACVVAAQLKRLAEAIEKEILTNDPDVQRGDSNGDSGCQAGGTSGTPGCRDRQVCGSREEDRG